MITNTDLTRALSAILPYAMSRLEDMGESLENGGCKGCKTCPPHEPKTCPQLHLAGSALTLAHAAIAGDTLALPVAFALYDRAKHAIDTAIEGG